MRDPMSVLRRIAAVFGRVDDDSTEPDYDALLELFRERETSLNLTAQYGRPYPNFQEEPTAVFPYTLFDTDDDVYGTGVREFPIPDNGTLDEASDLVNFVANNTGIDPSDVGRGDLGRVEGVEADATLESGDIVVHYPTIETENDEAVETDDETSDDAETTEDE